MEYTLELTKEGHNRQSNSHDYGYGNSYSNNYGYGSNTYSSNYKKSTGIADLIVFFAVALVIYALYKTCIDTPNNQTMGDRQYSSTGNDYPGGSPGGGGWFGGNSNQGNQGYNQNYGTGYNNDTCGGNQRRHGTGGGGGFWSGMATGGLLGYMFGGNRG